MGGVSRDIWRLVDGYMGLKLGRSFFFLHFYCCFALVLFFPLVKEERAEITCIQLWCHNRHHGISVSLPPPDTALGSGCM